MKIVFNLLGTGLANNGGSKTLVRMAGELHNLGHKVSIACTANKYSLTAINVPITNSLPSQCDVVIATGQGSVKTTLKYKGTKRKFYYVRAFENWHISDDEFIKTLRSGLYCITNAKWIKKLIGSLGHRCELAYQGLDFDLYKNIGLSRSFDIGGVHSGVHTKYKRKRHIDLLQMIELGGLSKCLLNLDFSSSRTEEMVDYYNSCKVWVSPSENEGLQNCPMEASLCGCAVVTTDHPHGVGDYAIDGETCLVYPQRNIEVAVQKIRTLLDDPALSLRLNGNMVEWLKKNVGSKQDAAKKFAEVLESWK